MAFAQTSTVYPGQGFDAHAITRPNEALLKHYLIMALLTGPFAVFVFPPLYFKYHTLKYRFDDEGIAASWGILWRREVYLTYRRIQDIHVGRGLIQRWLGLASIAVQTASGSSAPELTIEGVLEYDALRDFLYQQMRGARGEGPKTVAPHTTATATASYEPAADDEALTLLRQVRDELALLRTNLERSRGDAA